MKNIEYWFYIEPYVHATLVKPDKVFMYNPLNYKHLTFNDRKIFSLVEETLSIDNLGVKKLNQRDLLIFKDFISCTREDFMSDYIPINQTRAKPLIFTGNPMILSETGGSSEEKLGKNVLYNLTQLTVFLNNDCNYACSLCHQYYKQTNCCYQDESKLQINSEIIQKLLIETKESSLLKLNLVGGNILNFSGIKVLVDDLNQYEFEKNYLFNIKHLTKDTSVLEKIITEPKNSVEIQIVSTKDISIIRKLSMHNLSKKVLFNFFVQSEEDIDEVNKYISIYSIENSRVTPIYNGINLKFFEQFVFTDVVDIFDEKVSEKEVKRNYILNDIFFGHLIIFPNGQVHSNISDNSLGRFPDNSINQLIHEELAFGNNWLKVRRKIHPCSICMYNCICQPISNYELAIGKPNLCHVNP